MANTFNDKVTRFQPVLDKVYKKRALTSILENPNTQWVGTNKIKLPMIEMDGAGDYDRSSGYTRGGVEVSYEDYELEFDRGRQFMIDVIDDDEAGFALYQETAVEYVRTKEVPEVDAVRFSRFASSATTVEENDDPDALKEFEKGITVLSDFEVSEEDLIAFVSNEFYEKLKQDLQGTGRWSIEEGTIGGVDRRFTMIDGVPIVKVPKGRFYDVVTLNDGSTGGQEDGGFEPDLGTSKKLHLVMGDRNAMQAYSKRNTTKIISPEVNQDADAWLVAYRSHHDAIVPANKENGIYVLKNATEVS